MKVLVKSIILLSATSTLFCAGYRIPEQSINSTALSAANVANVYGADASYYNPANMSWMKNNEFFEASLTYIKLNSIDYEHKGLGGELFNGTSKKENFLIPTFFYISKIQKDFFRYGISFTSPFGLTKRWNSALQKASAEKFSLKVLELNPSISFLASPNLSIGVGVRFIYSEGEVKSSSTEYVELTNNARADFSRDMDGDEFKLAYNFAMSYKASENLTLAATYRTKAELDENGHAKLYAFDEIIFKGGSSVKILLPAILSLASSYKYKNTTFEFVYERNYWSEYKDLDFEYNKELEENYAILFDAPIEKDWHDSSTFRLGITHKYSDKLTLMCGFAIDKTPVPYKTLGFELPDSHAKMYSFGFDYKVKKNLNFGMAYLYDKKEDREIVNDKVNGEFSNGGAHMVTVGLKYKF